ncbi:MAG: hypothetical protein EAZ06_04840 [Cytophagales bacterium]|nr:MAG: hypothetical protein EAZ06_04840 [Cytophagales bacterium]
MKNLKILLIATLCVVCLAQCKKKNTDPPISKCYKGLLLYPDIYGHYVNVETTDNIGEVWKPFGGPNEYQRVILIKGVTAGSIPVRMVRNDTIYFKLSLDQKATCEGSPTPLPPGVIPLFPPNTIKQQYCATYLSKTPCQ